MLRTTNSTAVVVLRGKKGAVNFHSRRPDNCREERDLTHIPQNAAENCAHTNSLAISEAIFHSKTAAALRTAVSWWWWTFKL